MMGKFRNEYEKLSIPIGRVSIKLGMKPDAWTAISFTTGLGAAVLFGFHQIWWGLFLMLIMSFTDSIDGATARAGHLESAYGGVLDHTVDRYVEIALIAGIMAGGYCSPLMGIFVISGMLMASYVRAAAESIGKMKNCVVGLAGRQEKFFILIVALILFAFNLNLIGQIAMALVGVLSHITAVQRMAYTVKHAGKEEQIN